MSPKKAKTFACKGGCGQDIPETERFLVDVDWCDACMKKELDSIPYTLGEHPLVGDGEDYPIRYYSYLPRYLNRS